ncbi:hypothetical protein Tco_0289063 [Tanacetum coccineum]
MCNYALIRVSRELWYFVRFVTVIVAAVVAAIVVIVVAIVMIVVAVVVESLVGLAKNKIAKRKEKDIRNNRGKPELIKDRDREWRPDVNLGETQIKNLALIPPEVGQRKAD